MGSSGVMLRAIRGAGGLAGSAWEGTHTGADTKESIGAMLLGEYEGKGGRMHAGAAGIRGLVGVAAMVASRLRGGSGGAHFAQQSQPSCFAPGCPKPAFKCNTFQTVNCRT